MMSPTTKRALPNCFRELLNAKSMPIVLWVNLFAATDLESNYRVNTKYDWTPTVKPAGQNLKEILEEWLIVAVHVIRRLQYRR
jgi:DNA gyrase/topoisomerase IV subunit A